MRQLTLFISDLIILYVALYATLVIRYGSRFGEQVQTHFVPFTVIFGLWVLVFYIVNLYELGIAKNNLAFYTRLLYVLIITAVLGLAFFYLVPGFRITPRANYFIFILITTVLLTAWRTLFNKLLHSFGTRNNTLILGTSDQARELYDFLLDNPQLGYRAIGMLDINDKRATKILERLIRQKKIKALILAPEAYNISDIMVILYRLVSLKIHFHGLANFYEQVTGKVPLRIIDPGWFLDNLSEGEKRGYEWTTRFIDVLGAVTLGIISLALYPPVIAGIKITKGPIFIRQRRMGKGGETFTLYKFRSMIANAPDGSAEGKTGAVWTQKKDDPRVTRFGGFIRKTRLDELPQLWNIFKGEMSFVGPRAERLEFHEKLKKAIPFYEERYLIKPGLVGWSQLKFGYGASVEDAEEKLKYDLYYIKNRSLLLDLGIVIKTISILARGTGSSADSGQKV